MKLKRLTIENIASIEKACIDFEAPPLKDEPLFLICGETGAGKTTLLDAICLALFNETPRMEQSGRETFCEQPGEKESELKTNDVRHLMRRNTAEASVELVFSGSNGKEYIARWQVARARRKLTGKIQRPTWQWEDLSGNTFLTHQAEIANEMKEAIGLSFTQFCRTVMLPQGGFTQFLQSKSGEKSEILEKLTGTEIYSLIGREIFEKAKKEKEEYERQKVKLEALHLLTDAELEQIEDEKKNLQSEVETLTRERETVQAKKTWIDRNKELDDNLKKQQAELEERQREIASEDNRKRRQLVDSFGATTEARQWLADYDEQLRRQTRNEREQEELKNTFLSLSEGKLYLEEENRKTSDEIDRTRKRIADDSELKPMFEKSQAITTDLKNIIAQENSIDTGNKELSRLKEKLPGLEQNVTDNQTRLQQLDDEISGRQSVIDSENKKFVAMNLDKLRNDKAETDRKLKLTDKAIDALRRMNEQREQHLSAIKTETLWREKLSEVTQLQPQLQRLYDEKNKARQEAEQLYDKQKVAVEDYASELRHHLCIGDNCPVCGSKIERIVTDDEFQSLLDPIRESLQKKKAEYLQAQKDLSENRSLQQTYRQQLKLQTEHADETKRKFELSRHEAQRACRTCGIETPGEDVNTVVAAMKETCDKQLETLSEQITEAETLMKKINKLQTETARLQHQKQSLQSSLDKAKEQLTQTRQSADSKILLIDKARKDIDTIHSRLTPLILWTDWQKEWDQDHGAFIDKIEQAADVYRQNVQREKDLEAKLSAGLAALSELQTTCQDIIRIYSSWQSITPYVPAERKDLNKEWRQLYAECRRVSSGSDDIRDRLTTRREQLTRFFTAQPEYDEEKLRQLSGHTAEEIESLRTTLRKQLEDLAGAQTLVEQTQQDIALHVGNKPHMKPEETSAKLSEDITSLDGKLHKVNQHIGQLNQQLITNRTNSEQREREAHKAEQLRTKWEKWERLRKHFGDSEGKTFRGIAQSYVLRELLYHANSYLSRLNPRYELECEPGSLVILLRDLYQGGVRRPSTTLSGGESFLVSLSLALGLSSFSRQTPSVETLFIDEGFGTLSNDYLNTVMDALQKLHSMDGKQVGIISHVDELRERIRTQIQVNRVDNSRSSVEVVRMM